jgi:hypothetical protein
MWKFAVFAQIATFFVAFYESFIFFLNRSWSFFDGPLYFFGFRKVEFGHTGRMDEGDCGRVKKPQGQCI